ncbi:class I SAM-dependent RNA methyltransferase [Yoonia sediminilitoris]|uniref:23S rRNA m(5)U-1939 methyltransferase n=1 Tax=Yoonia sediminilitoris TaxID=1286148 RepID=A0A2T6KLS5_9RHOB|nr:class I SAM-dependent RNA methyltransferase [Yoonia sediminilitoris]PUB17153.1 23S rRNA m(5)U-1939 methyltransferase [Yoonia sediminilitoris]RCW97448.1 23S rRNA m(5)U-1939 methyltransferase [Yoonia sediminilitoris]
MLTIESLTHLGLGRASDGRSLLPRVLPGEEVDVAQDGTLRIVTPSADRVAAPCRHFKSCGGCAMQHATDAFVADWKLGIVQKALHAQGITPAFRNVMTSPVRSRRRAKFSGRRTKKGAMVGFHGKGSNTLVAVPDCQLVTPALTASLPALEELTVMACSRKGEIDLTVTEAALGVDVLVETDKAITPQLRVALAAFAQKNGLTRLVWNDEPVVTINPPTQHFGDTGVVPPPGAFLQATKDGELALLAAVEEIVGGAKRVVDLFAGCGTFTLPLAKRSEVHAVEGEAEMLEALDRGWREGFELRRVTTETRDLFRRPLETDELGHFDAAVIDPPRAGAEAQIATLAASDIKTIAMVSCNPVTFARDASRLIDAGFTLDWVQVVDQFRWSPHVEIVAPFKRK